MTHTALRPRRLVAAVTALALAVTGIGAASIAAAPEAQAAYPDTFNPFAMSGGFTVYAREDALLQNQETEGSIAVGGTATVQGSSGTYSIIHVAAGTGDYTLPTVDGDPTRFLVGEYDTASTGILAITSAGTSDPTLQGDLKLVDRGGPFQPFARADWTRLNTNPANVDQTPLIDATHQPYPGSATPPVGVTGGGSIYTSDTSSTAVADYVEANQEASYEAAAQCLDGLNTTGYPVGVAEDAGSSVVLDELSPDQPNIVDYADIAGAGLIQYSAGPTPGATNPLIIQVPAGTTEVIGARSDPQGQYSPYIFWDLSKLTGDVTVTAAESRIDGSIYAPEANVTVTASPLDGQVLGNNVTIAGGEVHSFLFAGEISCDAPAPEGTFQMQKAIADPAPDLPDGTVFTVNYSAALPDGTTETGSLDLPADGTLVPAGVSFPDGTVITFSEIAPPTVPGWEWGTPTIVENPLTIDADAPTTPTVTVTNSATQQLGTVSVRKAVVDGEGNPVPGATGDITADWSASDGQSGTVTFPADGSQAVTLTVDGDTALFPIGTTVTLSGEVVDDASAPDGYEWVDAGWSPSDTITVDDTGTAEVTLTNTVAPESSSRVVAVRKTVAGEAESAFAYSITYSTDLDPETTVPLPVGRPVILDIDPLASEITIGENAPTQGGLPVDTTGWLVPSITVGTVTQDVPFGESATFDLDGEAALVGIQIDNALERGTFTLQKAFQIGAAFAPAAARPTFGFMVDWTATEPDGTVTSGTVRIPAGGAAVSPTDATGKPLTFPYGTVITYDEVSAPNVPGIEWGTPTYAPAQLVIGTDDSATVAATVTNSATLEQGTFQVRKELEGIDADQLLVDDITVRYTGLVPGQGTVTGTFEIPTDGTPAGPVDDGGNPLTFPIGSVFQLSEVTTPEEALPPGYEWTGTTWSPSSFVVIRPGAVTPTLTVTNSVEQLTRYSIVKTVEGDGADQLPPGTTIPVDWWLDYEAQPQLALVPDQVITSRYFPVGSIIEAREATPPTVPGVVWGTPTYLADGVELTPQPDGKVVIPAASVDSQGVVELVLQNQADLAPTASFSVTKTVTGGAAASVPVDRTYALQYTVDGGPIQALTVQAGQTVTVADVPADAVVRVREVPPSAISGVEWGTPSWSAGGQALTPDADGWVTADLSSGETLAFALTNTATAPLPNTGGTWSPVVAYVGLAALLLGAAFVLRRRRQTV